MQYTTYVGKDYEDAKGFAETFADDKEPHRRPDGRWEVRKVRSFTGIQPPPERSSPSPAGPKAKRP